MGKRDRLRALFTTKNTTSLATYHTVSLLPAQSTSSSRAPSPSPPSCLSTSSTVLPDATTQRSLVLQKALEKTLEELPQAQKEVFAQASKTIDEQTLLSQVRAHDTTHKQQSSFRPQAERLSKFLHLLSTFMGGVAIGIQASPEISSLVVGSVRIVIDLAIKFTVYFSKLTDMVCTFQDYLGPLAEYAKAADIKLVEETVVNAYTKLLCFGWKARHVFIDANDNHRKWTSFRTFMRQHWEPFESEFGIIKENLEHDVNILLHSVNALHFNLARKDEEARRRREEAKEKSEFLNWVSSIDFEQTHQDTFAKKHDKTGDWLIKHPDYQQWLTSQRSCLLWCHGKPGIGKTVLASNVIEDITKEITTNVGLRDDAALCFAYYHYQNTQLKDLHQIVAALIKQLCRRKIQLPPDLLETKRDALPPSLLGTRERFLSLIEDLSQVYLVLDALDECPEKERGDILGFITGIVTAQVGCQVKVFVTSRHEMDIDRAFSYRLVPTIQIQTKNVAADIEDYVRSQVEKLQTGGYGKTLYIRSSELKERIIQTLATKAEGMFLWVNLQLDNLCQASKAQKDQVVEAALDAMPQDLPETYVRIMERIEAQSPYMRELAINCLAWTIYAQRPLTTWELQEALAVSSNCETIQDLQLDSRRVILEACGNLLEESNLSIRPIHYTVQEFLTSAIQRPSQQPIREQLLDSKAMHNRLSLACLSYLGRPVFTRPCIDVNHIEYSVRMFAFAGYACHGFDYHILLCGELRHDVNEKLESLLQQGNERLAAILQIKVLRDSYDFYKLCDRFNRMDFSITPSTIVYSTLLYNIPTIRQRWIGQTPPTYALHLAASARLTKGVIRLLDAGCDVNEKDNAECTPLHYACLNGGMKTAQLLIDKGAEIEAESRRYGSPLQVASNQGHAQVVEMLLKHANFQKQDIGSRSALLLASRKGHEQVVEILLDNGANIEVLEDRYGALHAASKKGYNQLVRMLLNRGADASVKNGGFSALQAATREGHEQIVRMLLDYGADANGIGDVSNALQAASYEGYEQIVQMLLDYGADVNAPGHNLGSALQAASSNGHKQIVQILLNHGADINAPGIHHGTALQAASNRGNVDVIQLLLDNGADINAPSGILNSPLQAASYNGKTEAVKMLLSNGADINGSYAPGYSTALHQAAHMGRYQVLQILLDSGADVNALSKQHGTALQEASRAGHQELVKILLARGANVNAPHDRFSSALQVASRKGHKEIVQMLLDAGAQYWEEYILSSCMDFFDSLVEISI